MIVETGMPPRMRPRPMNGIGSGNRASTTPAATTSEKPRYTWSIASVASRSGTFNCVMMRLLTRPHRSPIARATAIARYTLTP